MAFFIRSSNPQLYVASSTSEDRGFAAFFLPSAPSDPPDGYDIDQALTDSSLNGTFLLSAYVPDLSTPTATDGFVKKVQALLGTGRYIIWLYDINTFTATQNTLFLPIQSDGSATIQGLTVPLVFGISLQVQNNIQLTASSDGIVLGSSSGSSRIQFTGPNAPDPNISNATTGTLALSGQYRGCISFSVVIVRSSFSNNGFSWGFQMLIPLQNNPNQNALAEYLPLASDLSPAPNDAIGFDITIDPTDVFNLAYDQAGQDNVTIQQQYNSRRTLFAFTGSNQDLNETLLTSCYFTTWGATVQLIPAGSNASGLRARLVFNEGEQYSANAQKSHLAPEGDFIVQLPGATNGTTYQLQCGLQGTEFFNVRSRTQTQAGDSIRFIANQAAYAPVYPLPQSSPVTAPVLPDAPLLDHTYRSSWCTVVSDISNPLPSYLAQPKGAALYGGTTGADTSLIGHATPNFTYTPNDITLFPMLPYLSVVPDATGAGAFSLEQIEDFERLFISTIRKKNINTVLIAAQQAAKTNYKKARRLQADTPATVTTPSGLLVGLLGGNDNPVWDAIYLAQNQQAGSSDFTKMYFANPGNELVQAFQTSDLFLVIANKEYIGTAMNGGSSAPVDDAPAFYNDMFIGDWGMQANTGTQNKYNDYNNIIIVKGRKGKLYDPNDVTNSLVANWQKWTDKEVFAAPSTLSADNQTLNDPDASQLVILSQWMQTYFENAANQTDTEYFGNFNSIASDPNWTGILILNMNIANLPANLNGILAGVRDPAAFRAHHFGINITPVQQGANGPEINTPSGMFGLIYYNDPAFIASSNPQPVQPDLSLTYDFVLLNLKVLFENTAVKSFQSYAQLTTNNYFGSPVDHMGTGGNTYNTMILKGALQFKGDEAIYSLATSGVNTFYFNSPIVNKVAITAASFSTVGTNADGDLVSLFSINGYWDFKDITIVTQDPDNGSDTCKATSNSTCTCTGTATCTCSDFDLLSFGNDIGADDPRKGLVFNNLGIQMVAAPYTPGQTEPSAKTMVFDTSKMTFDQGRSTARPNSIYVNFALNLQNLAQGDADSLPIGKDYLTVITDLAVTPIAGSPWVGLSYQLNMGTPGALAANVGLTSTLLIAWNPAAKDDDTAPPPVLVGIKLPGTGGGAKLISLQSVLKLSIGQIRLSCVKNTDPVTSAVSYSFLMMFTEIALKFLGLLKIPPNGSSLFYLFGNPQSDGKASGLGWYAMYKKDQSATTIK